MVAAFRSFFDGVERAGRAEIEGTGSGPLPDARVSRRTGTIGPANPCPRILPRADGRVRRCSPNASAEYRIPTVRGEEGP